MLFKLSYFSLNNINISNERRIVLLGKTRVGKSSLANTIFGEEVFKFSYTANSETKQCQEETRCVNGRSITLIDTPGFFDTDRSEEVMKPESPQGFSNCHLCTPRVYSLSNERRIVLLGKTGAGKSSLANTIFGEEVFNVGHTANSETKKCQEETRSVNGKSVTLIDTPGFFDTDSKSVEAMKPEILRCITECAPGLHAFLIVLKVERFTEHEQDVIKKIQQHFSEEVFKYATVVFTHGDQLPEGQTIENYFLENELLSDLVKKCGGCCHVIDNRFWKEKPKDKYRSNQFQVKELLNRIEATVMENNGSFFTNEMLQTVEEEIQQEEETIRLLPGNLTDKEIRKQAKVGVFKKLWIKLAGIGTGTLLGALFGAVAMVRVAVLALKKMGPLSALVTNPVAVVGAAAAVGASAGAGVGGVIGYQAAEGAGSPKEASKRAAEAVCKEAKSAAKKVREVYSELVQPKFKHS